MSSDDPTRTVHFALADALDVWMGRSGRLGRGLRDAVTANDPDRRDFYAVMVAGAWFALTVACIAAMLVLGIAVDALVDDRAGDVVVAAFLAAALFCAAGVVNALWRKYWYVPRARRALGGHGADGEQFAALMRRTLPRNSSLVCQAAVAIIAFLVAVS